METDKIISKYEEKFRDLNEEYDVEVLSVIDENFSSDLPQARFEVFDPQKGWVIVDYVTFRSWTGMRMVNGKKYVGPHYWFLTTNQCFLQ